MREVCGRPIHPEQDQTMKWIITGGGVVFALFCIFGFIASGELNGASETRWKAAYAIAGVVAMGGAFLLSRRRPGSH
ncbi:MAG: hypothetical protein ACI92S_000156 [Planctomycetaceae bacterium]|jgi:hypothetical protein